MDNKIKYVDLNGLKVFAEALKQDLKNHVLELGLYQELLHRIENLELYKIVDLLPEKGDEDTIYLLKNPSGSGDKNVFIEYLYNNEHGWEEIGNFTPSFDLEDYLKVEDAPFEKGEAENSAVLKGGNNQVISEGSVALGKDNISGLKGWYYKAVQIGNDGNVVYLYLTTEQQIPVLVSSASAVENQEKDININISKGDICSIINGNRLIDCFEFRLNEISKYGRISFIYKGKETNPLSTIQNVEELKLEDYSVFCISKPSCGIVELSKCNIALGNNTKSLAESSVSIGLRSTAVGITSYAEGQDTIAVGECSHAEGAFTKSNGIASHTEGFGTQTEELSAHAEGYNTLASGGASHSEGSATKAIGLHSHAEGDTTEASGEQSHAEGKQTIAEGQHSHAEGDATIASGDNSHTEGCETLAEGESSHAEGVGTQTKNNGEHAEGRFNKSNSAAPNEGSNPGNTAHSVGIGTSSVDRKNAHEIMQDGKHYILGIGGYNGTNPDKATDVASELTELSAEVSGLSEKVDKLPLPTAESSVFKAVYGTTTIEEVTEAYNQGKVIHCDYNGMCFVLSAFNGGQAFFTSLSANYSTRLELKSDSRWAISYFTMEENKNKVKTISSSSTDTQYPSAKAVYEALQNVGGGSSVFEAIYGETTYDELVAAVKAKKHVICFYNNRVYNLCNYQEGMDIFFSCVTSAVYTVMCAVANGKWTASQYNFENTVYKVTSLSDKSTDTQYPSAKAVYDAIQQSGGGSATPDWSANEDEEGHIKNRTHYKTESVEIYEVDDAWGEDGEYFYNWNLSFPSDKKIDSISFTDGEIESQSIQITEEETDFSVYIEDNKHSLLGTIHISEGENKEVSISAQGSIYFGSLEVNIKSQDVKPLSEEYIPSTIARKSDIVVDPIVWKYICNPLIIEEGTEIPDELYDEDKDWLKYEYPAMYRFYDGMEYKFCVKANYDRLTDSKDQDWGIYMKTFYMA